MRLSPALRWPSSLALTARRMKKTQPFSMRPARPRACPTAFQNSPPKLAARRRPSECSRRPRNYMHGKRRCCVQLGELRQLADRIRGEIAKAVIGQADTVNLMLTALFAGGHVLLEGPPGTAKTLLAQCFARTLDLAFGRV